MGLHIGLMLATLAVPTGLGAAWVIGAKGRLVEMEAAGKQEVAVAQAADEGYCNADLKKILRRVLTSCGLIGAQGGRGCQPTDAKQVAALGGGDFNALFLPLEQRAGIIQFEKSSADLDDADKALLDKIYADQGGASYFFVVSRSSPEGSEVFNRDLSQKRGQAVLDHLQTTFKDPDMEKQVGLLWLGEEFAQLDKDFCTWNRSGAECAPADLNRSSFVAWIDCRL